MDNGSILHNLSVFTAIFLNNIIQDVLVAAKWARLDEIIGNLKEEKEEELEGEVLGVSDTGSLLFPPLFYYFTDQIHMCICLYCLFFFITFPFR